MPRRAARTDANHTAIVDAFKAHGWAVLSLAGMGDGCPDLLVCGPDEDGELNILYLIEVKDGDKPPSKRKLTDKQVKFHSSGWPVAVVKSIEDVKELCT